MLVASLNWLLPPERTIWAMTIVRRLRGKIIRTFLRCIVYDSCAQWYTQTCEHFLNFRADLDLDFVMVCSYSFSILCAFCISLNHFITVLLAFVVLDLVFFSTKPRDWLGGTSLKWPGVEWDIEILTTWINLSWLQASSTVSFIF